MRNSILVIAALLTVSAPAVADCGEPPIDIPTVPKGETAVSASIRTARDAVINFSKEVDDYLACMDQRAQLILPYLTKEQKARWDEDLANLHNKRRDLQTEMNMAIRSYRKASKGQ